MQIEEKSYRVALKEIESQLEIDLPDNEPATIKPRSWNDEDVIKLVEGRVRFGKDYQAIADYIGSKSSK